MSVSAFFSAGHIDHSGDIYKAFTYVKHGQTFNVGARGDTSLLQYDDCQRAKPEQPDFPPEVVETYGNSATGNGVVTGTRTSTNFKAVFNTATWTWDKVQDGDPVVVQISRPLSGDERERVPAEQGPVGRP